MHAEWWSWSSFAIGFVCGLVGYCLIWYTDDDDDS